MKISYLTSPWKREPHTVRVYAESLASAFALSDNQLIVDGAASHDGVFDGITFRKVTANKSFVSTIVWSFGAVMRHVLGRPDIVHVSGAASGFIAALYRFLRPGSTIIWTKHTLVEGSAFARSAARFFDRLAYKYSDASLTTDRSVQRYMQIERSMTLRYVPRGVSKKHGSVHPAVLDARGISLYGYVLFDARGKSDRDIERVLATWNLYGGNRQLVILGNVAVESEHVLVLTDERTDYVLQTLYAAALAVVGLTEEDALESMSHGTLPLFVHRPFFDVPDACAVTLVGTEEEKRATIDSLFTEPMQSVAVGHAARSFVEEYRSWEVLAEAYLDEYERQQLLHGGVYITN